MSQHHEEHHKKAHASNDEEHHKYFNQNPGQGIYNEGNGPNLGFGNAAGQDSYLTDSAANPTYSDSSNYNQGSGAGHNVGHGSRGPEYSQEYQQGPELTGPDYGQNVGGGTNVRDQQGSGLTGSGYSGGSGQPKTHGYQQGSGLSQEYGAGDQGYLQGPRSTGSDPVRGSGITGQEYSQDAGIGGHHQGHGHHHGHGHHDGSGVNSSGIAGSESAGSGYGQGRDYGGQRYQPDTIDSGSGYHGDPVLGSRGSSQYGPGTAGLNTPQGSEYSQDPGVEGYLQGTGAVAPDNSQGRKTGSHDYGSGTTGQRQGTGSAGQGYQQGPELFDSGFNQNSGVGSAHYQPGSGGNAGATKGVNYGQDTGVGGQGYQQGSDDYDGGYHHGSGRGNGPGNMGNARTNDPAGYGSRAVSGDGYYTEGRPTAGHASGGYGDDYQRDRRPIREEGSTDYGGGALAGDDYRNDGRPVIERGSAGQDYAERRTTGPFKSDSHSTTFEQTETRASPTDGVTHTHAAAATQHYSPTEAMANMTLGQKMASLIPGTQANKEKNAAYQD